MNQRARTMRGAEDPDPNLERTDAQEEKATEPEDQFVVVEYVGHQPFGREFHSSHTIEKSSAKLGAPSERKSFAGQGIEVPEDLVWSKDTGWIVKVDRSLTDLLAALRTQPDLKVHE